MKNKEIRDCNIVDNMVHKLKFPKKNKEKKKEM